MPNVCQTCEKEVIPDPIDGHCPNCGSKIGYIVRQTWFFRNKIESAIEKYNDQIERIKKIQEIYKGTKVEENLEKEIQKLQQVIRDLQSLLPKTQSKEIKIEDFGKSEDQVNIDKSEQELAHSTSSFLQKGDDIVKTSTDEIINELRSLREENSKLHNSSSRLTKWGIAYTLIGVLIGVIGSYLITITNPPQIIIINATSGTPIP
jgi:DNA repair exonuclease SbcCD ATPase subunit